MKDSRAASTAGSVTNRMRVDMQQFTCQQPECDEALEWRGNGRHPEWCSAHMRLRRAAQRASYGRTHPDSPSAACAHDECTRLVRAKGLCNMHYMRGLRLEGRITNEPWGDKRKSHWHARRARKNGATEGEAVTLTDIIARDGTDCQWCGMPVDLELAYPHRMSKSIDHIVPISREGAHSLANTQLMHNACNSSKGNRQALTAS